MIKPVQLEDNNLAAGASYIDHLQFWIEELNAPQDLTNCRIDIAFRQSPNYEIAILRISTDDFVIIDNECDGRFTIYIPSELTTLLDSSIRRLYYDIVVSKSDYSYHIASGKLNVTRLATRPDQEIIITQEIPCPKPPAKPQEDHKCPKPNYATGITLPNIRINGRDIGCRNCSSQYIEQLIKDGIISRKDLDKLANLYN